MDLNDITRLALQEKPTGCICQFPSEIDTTTHTGHSPQCNVTNTAATAAPPVTTPHARPGAMVQSVLINITVPSWNEVWSSPHWSVRYNMAKRIKEQVGPYLPLLKPQATPCVIVAQVQRVRTIDPDNILLKPIIDALRPTILPDDTANIIRNINLSCISSTVDRLRLTLIHTSQLSGHKILTALQGSL